MDYNYVIFNVSELDKIDFNQVAETSIDTVRYSLDNLRTFVKWIGDTPSCVESLTIKEYHTHSEMLEIVNNSEWQVPIPF